MGHLGTKEAYKKLGRKIDRLQTKAPQSETLYRILKELYTPEEADVVVRMPYGLANIEDVSRVTGYGQAHLQNILENLAHKGLVFDLWINGEYKYSPSPVVIGIFEFTMMRTSGKLDYRTWAKLFHEYLNHDFFAANYGSGQIIAGLRAIPYEESVVEAEYTEILDYEKATAIVEMADNYAIGICSCRHEKLHTDAKQCATPLDTCSTVGYAADYLIRNGLAKKVSKSEMLDNITRSKELGLAFCGDNVRSNVSFICHCCKCCCNALAGITKFGFPNSVVSSNYIATWEDEKCTGCGKCAKACPIDAIAMKPNDDPRCKRKAGPGIADAVCLGCGVCASKCVKEAMKLTHRQSRVFHPENLFERVILRSLELGTLQYQMFGDPGRITHKFLRGFVGGFLRLPPVKRKLMSDKMRSRFLESVKQTVARQGKDWITRM